MRTTLVVLLALFLFSAYSPPAKACERPLVTERLSVSVPVEPANANPPFAKISMKLRACELILTCETRHDKPAPLFVAPSKTISLQFKVRVIF